MVLSFLPDQRCNTHRVNVLDQGLDDQYTLKSPIQPPLSKNETILIIRDDIRLTLQGQFSTITRRRELISSCNRS
jgi:hypothetical protein